MEFKNKKGKRRVVLTSAGAITPIGNNVADFWQGLVAGANGIGPITTFEENHSRVSLAAEVKNFKPEDYFSRKEIRRMDRSTQLALAACKEAIENADLDLSFYDPYRMGVVLGSGIGGYHTIEDEIVKFMENGKSNRAISSLFIPKYISNMTPGRIAMTYPIYGSNFSLSTACASSTNAIGEAFHKITDGYLDMCVTGGFESAIAVSSVTSFDNMTALSRQTDPELASRPFDKDRDGFVIAEGAVILILESLESASARGAKIICEVTGYGSTSDGYHITSPDPEGKGDSKAIELALEDAGIEASAVDYFNAHGTSTSLNDKYETVAIKKGLGSRAEEIPLSSIKGNIGHMLGAAGAAEALATALIIQNSLIPKTRGLVNKDADCDLDYVYNENRKANVDVALSNNLGFGGQNAVIVLEKYKG